MRWGWRRGCARNCNCRTNLRRSSRSRPRAAERARAGGDPGVHPRRRRAGRLSPVQHRRRPGPVARRAALAANCGRMRVQPQQQWQPAPAQQRHPAVRIGRRFDVVVSHGPRLRAEIAQPAASCSICRSFSVGSPAPGFNRSSPGCPSGSVAPAARGCRWRRGRCRRRCGRWWRRCVVQPVQLRRQPGGCVVSDRAAFLVGIGVVLEAAAGSAPDDGQCAAVPPAGLIGSAFPAVDVALAFAHQFEVHQDRAGLFGVGERQRLGEPRVGVVEPALQNRERARRERRLRPLDHVEALSVETCRRPALGVTVPKVRYRRIARNHNRNHLDGGDQRDQHHGRREHQQPSSQRQPRRSARGHHRTTSRSGQTGCGGCRGCSRTARTDSSTAASRVNTQYSSVRSATPDVRGRSGAILAVRHCRPRRRASVRRLGRRRARRVARRSGADPVRFAPRRNRTPRRRPPIPRSGRTRPAARGNRLRPNRSRTPGSWSPGTAGRPR